MAGRGRTTLFASYSTVDISYSGRSRAENVAAERRLPIGRSRAAAPAVADVANRLYGLTFISGRRDVNEAAARRLAIADPSSRIIVSFSLLLLIMNFVYGVRAREILSGRLSSANFPVCS